MNVSAFFIYIGKRTTGEEVMNSQKLENSLNLALDADEEELRKSASLRTGYLQEEKKWELIIRYYGEIGWLAERGIQVEELIGGYGIVTVPETLIPYISSVPEIEYVEKPSRLFLESDGARAASCISQVQGGGVFSDRRDLNLSGRGVITAIIDSGIDFTHPDFRKEDGTTRILELWDQNLGRVFSKEELDAALELEDREAAGKMIPSVDVSGHGTAVAGIAVGNGRASGGRYRGVAYESSLLVVKLGNRGDGFFPWTTELMRALDFVIRRGQFYNMPVAVNLSFGNNYGSHDGTNLLETYINDISRFGRSSVVIGTGNEGAGYGHTSGTVKAGELAEVELAVGTYETGFSFQLWKSYVDQFTISLMTPSGEIAGTVAQPMGTQRMRYGNTQILLYHGFPSPYSQAQEIYFDFLPQNAYLDSGVWRILIRGEKIVHGRYDLWLPSASTLNSATRFLRPDPEITLTIPSTAALAISVGAYDDAYQAYADFSGRGFTRLTNQVKPDLSAPGTDIPAPRPGGGYTRVTGTSFAAPFVTGSAALLMEWGIVNGNDPYLYGEKIKAYLRRGARQIPGMEVWPNPMMGYGRLCVRNSIPE